MKKVKVKKQKKTEKQKKKEIKKYFAKYWEENKEKRNEARRKRYQTDMTYRQKVIDRALAFYEKNKEEKKE